MDESKGDEEINKAENKQNLPSGIILLKQAMTKGTMTFLSWRFGTQWGYN